MPAISTVTFDLWGTLILDSDTVGRNRGEARVEGTWRTLKDDGFDVSIERVRESYRHCLKACEEIRSQERDVSFQGQIEIFLDAIEQGLAQRLNPSTVEQIANHYAGVLMHWPPSLAPGAQETLKTLKGRGYKLGLICNSGATPGTVQRNFLAQLGVADYFGILTFSDEQRVAKPAPLIFYHTLAQLKAPSEEAVHVGDNPLTDVVGAKRVGMKAILISSSEPKETSVEPDAIIHKLIELIDLL